MKRKFSNDHLAAIVGLAFLTVGCPSGGVGDPCTPEDEYTQEFSGFSVGEVNVESRSFQCETPICLVNHFQGRVSGPYGQTQAVADTSSAASLSGKEPDRCRIPGTDGVSIDDRIKVAVEPQLEERQAEKAVYC